MRELLCVCVREVNDSGVVCREQGPWGFMEIPVLAFAQWRR